MSRRHLFWQLYPSIVLVVLVALAGLAVLLPPSVERFYRRQLAQDLEERARLLAEVLRERDLADPGLQNLVVRLGVQTGARYTLVDRSGRVLADSARDVAALDNHADRPEIRTAFAGAVGHSIRFSNTLKENLYYLAVPLVQGGATSTVVRVSLPLTTIEAEFGQIRSKIVGAGLLAVVLAVGASAVLSRRISRPMVLMQRGARRFADGHLGERLKIGGSLEAQALAESLNSMASQLDERLQTVIRQRNEQEAMLASMIEGVLAVDNQERILRINRAAAALLGVNEGACQGKGLREVVRKADLQTFVETVLTRRQPQEGELVLLDEVGERYLQANGTLIHDANGRQIGALVVLNDVSRLRRLEGVRREFVANVSHELKTPITAIKGFIETLLDHEGTQAHPEIRQFLDIVIKQADRLNAIIEDLLDLSRIEQDAERDQVELMPQRLLPLLENAAQTWQHKALTQQVEVQLLAVPPDIQAPVNAPLLEQAVINLVDNAIKYSAPGKRVEVQVRAQGGGVEIAVRDQGCGIPEEHLPRLFERFYRVDKARSRKLGGTGLGLAIVKHIAQAHGGRVEVQSRLGEGTTFRLWLPAETAAATPSEEFTPR